jgi:hypothetical protein
LIRDSRRVFPQPIIFASGNLTEVFRNNFPARQSYLEAAISGFVRPAGACVFAQLRKYGMTIG